MIEDLRHFDNQALQLIECTLRYPPVRYFSLYL
jgi:hypothetical protein